MVASLKDVHSEWCSLFLCACLGVSGLESVGDTKPQLYADRLNHVGSHLDALRAAARVSKKYFAAVGHLTTRVLLGTCVTVRGNTEEMDYLSH